MNDKFEFTFTTSLVYVGLMLLMSAGCTVGLYALYTYAIVKVLQLMGVV